MHTFHSIPRQLSARALLALCLTMVSGLSDAAPYYKWTDAKGVTHFTDKPPKDQEVQKVNQEKRIPKTHAEAAAEVQATKDAAALDERRKGCNDEKNRLSTLNNNPEIQTRNADGSLRLLTKDEVQREIALSEKKIKEVCEGL